MFDFTEPLFWFSLSVILLIIEFLGAGALFAVIFALAALVSAGAAFFTDNLYILGATFVSSSFVFLFILKPTLERVFKTNKTTVSSNINSIVGSKGLVTKTITELEKGTVTINHEEWAATTSTDSTIEAGEQVIVEKVEGATLHVCILKKERALHAHTLEKKESEQ